MSQEPFRGRIEFHPARTAQSAAEGGSRRRRPLSKPEWVVLIVAAFVAVFGKGWVALWIAAFVPFFRGVRALAHRDSRKRGLWLTVLSLVAGLLGLTNLSSGSGSAPQDQQAVVAPTSSASVAHASAKVSSSHGASATVTRQPSPSTPTPSATSSRVGLMNRSSSPSPSASNARTASTTSHPTTTHTTQTTRATQTTSSPKSKTTQATLVPTFSNCKSLHQVYPHGVGLPGAVDKSGKRVKNTPFTVNRAVYQANSRLDRDGDGVACEA